LLFQQLLRIADHGITAGVSLAAAPLQGEAESALPLLVFVIAGTLAFPSAMGVLGLYDHSGAARSRASPRSWCSVGAHRDGARAALRSRDRGGAVRGLDRARAARPLATTRLAIYSALASAAGTDATCGTSS
jgi:hypothetical protein